MKSLLIIEEYVSEKKSEQFIDSGATKHMTFQKNIITDYRKYIRSCQRSTLVIKELLKHMDHIRYCEGNVKLEYHDGAETIILNLHKVLFVPENKKNLLSVPAMTQMQAEVIFHEEKCYIIKNGKTINIGHLLDGKLLRLL